MRIWIVILFLGIAFQLTAQDEKPKKWALGGYVKDLQSIFLFHDPLDLTLTDNLIHHRLNFKWFPDQHWQFKAELRNRIFWGETVKLTPGFGDMIDDANNDIWDLSLVLVNKDAAVIHAMLDRLYLEFVTGNLEMRFGRQRINWGQNLVWNPNDWFNAYSFSDFDYEERPGADALRVQYYTGVASSIELVVKSYTSDFDNWVGGFVWRFNKAKYDFQIQAGYVQRDLALGAGWAGSIGNAGFKGEISYFQPHREGLTDDWSIIASTEFDYSFKNALYLAGAFLFNSNGEVNGNINDLLFAELSAKNLYPFRYSFLIQAGYPITPLMNIAGFVVYSPGSANALFVNPAVTYSIAENWDLDFVTQFAFANNGQQYKAPFQLFFLRLKFSY
ncbi:MAG: hypothetical protein AAF502_14660 [Bacteroidota bacterium]